MGCLSALLIIVLSVGMRAGHSVRQPCWSLRRYLKLANDAFWLPMQRTIMVCSVFISDWRLSLLTASGEPYDLNEAVIVWFRFSSFFPLLTVTLEDAFFYWLLVNCDICTFTIPISPDALRVLRIFLIVPCIVHHLYDATCFFNVSRWHWFCDMLIDHLIWCLYPFTFLFSETYGLEAWK